MAGGLISVIAYGTQDMFLTGEPEVTWFKSMYRRYSHFALEAIEQTFTGNPDFGRRVTVIVSKNADLIGRTYLSLSLPEVTADGSGFSWVNEIGHNLVSSVIFDIGGQEIDKHYGEWLTIWNDLTLPAGKTEGYNAMIGNVVGLTGSYPSFAVAASSAVPQTPLYVPFVFSWNRHSHLHLPLISLSFHDVKLVVEFKSFANCHRGEYTGSTPSLQDATIWIDYVYLDNDERRLFAKGQHEYLIEQLQFQGDEALTGINNKVKMNFNHPVKEIHWIVRRNDNMDSSSNHLLDWTNYTDAHSTNAGDNPVLTTKMQLNGQDRFAVRDGLYFNTVQHYQNHTNTGRTGLNSYSFALKPEEHQPSGTTNFSRIDNAQLNVTLTSAMTGVDSTVSVYAVNYNILRIASGMGGLAFAT